MLAIYLVRHGQDVDNANDILNGHRNQPLTDIGLSQAQELASKVQALSVSFDKVYTSPLQRAFRTAEIISSRVNLPKPEIMPELIERDFGIMTGKAISSIEQTCSPNTLKTNTILYFLNPEGAETFPQVLIRAKRVLSVIKTSHNYGNIILVTHGDIGKMIYAAYYDLDWVQVLKLFHFGNSELLELSPRSSHTDTHLHKAKQYNL